MSRIGTGTVVTVRTTSPHAASVVSNARLISAIVAFSPGLTTP